MAYRREIAARVSFPAPTNWLLVPPGYEGSRAVALKVLNRLLLRAHSFIDFPVANPDSPPAVTAEHALADLPPIHVRQFLAAGKLRPGPGGSIVPSHMIVAAPSHPMRGRCARGRVSRRQRTA